MNCRHSRTMGFTLIVSGLLLGIIVTGGMATPIEVDKGITYQIRWLEQFHYLGSSSIIPNISSLSTSDAFTKAVKTLQMFVGLPQTGIVDDATLAYMKSKRCGMADMNTVMFTRRRKRYVKQGSQYPRGKTLTYRINIYSTKFDQYTQDDIFRTAFEFWSRAADIKFQQVRDTNRNVDIDIMFTTGSHGDYEAFDGRGGILAHAFFPSFGGDEHYDDDETWTHREHRGTNLLQTVTHEIGHTLGLSHSGNAEAVMFPYIRPYNPSFRLGSDDIMGVQSIYGPAPTYTNAPAPTYTNAPATMAPPTRPKNTPAPPDRFDPFDNCFSGAIDDATQTSDGATYIFRGEYVYKINGLGIDYGYPVKISDPQFGFSPMAGPIDAALYLPTTKKTYLFKDYYVAVYNGRTFENYYYIDQIFKIPKEAENMDTVFYWPRNGKTYVTKGDTYWRLRSDTLTVDPGYPQPMSKWSLPGGVDAGFEYSNKRTYFFKGSQYYKFDDANIKLSSGYPRPINYWWFGCRSNSISSGLKTPESGDTDTQMNVVQTVEHTQKENPFSAGNSSTRSQISFGLICGLIVLTISHRLNNILS